MASVTPMMQQYLDLKKQYHDCILFFRLGDFYEMFFDDAQTASRELEIALTGRDCGLDSRAPMCGVPFHAADTYITRLVTRGYKVAICEQLEDPALARGIVRRDVIRVITPGTITETGMLDDRKNHYILSLFRQHRYFGIAVADLSTGDFRAAPVTLGDTLAKMLDECVKYMPSEIIVSPGVLSDGSLMAEIRGRTGAWITPLSEDKFDSRNARALLADKLNETPDDRDGFDLSMNAAGALLQYLLDTQKTELGHMRMLDRYQIESYMHLDLTTRKNLELVETIRDRNRKGSLLWVLDSTVTAMGARLLRKWVEQPLLRPVSIQERLDAVETFKNEYMVRSEIREVLKRVHDIERLTGRIAMGNVNARDLVSLKNSLCVIPAVRSFLDTIWVPLVRFAHERLGDLSDITSLLETAFVEDPPVSVKEGGLLRTGFAPEVDQLRAASRDGKNWITALETRERENTGIKSLKISYNRVFGYYIEITRSNLGAVPEHYIRKQTLANCERYVTDELKQMEDTILGAEERSVALEYEIFIGIREQVASHTERLKNAAEGIALLDVLTSLAMVADTYGYVKPVIDRADVLDIREGRHPVVERMGQNGSSFVPNDTLLDLNENRVAIITGPNMAGKSTYMRQTALIVLMAQTGSFVPAKSARIGLVDRIFTRVGASDDLFSGQSTFM
ncbi:MAG TPA: DNA mismatch repair protein MutS, partial [Clostridiales bacterium]|nr:DNA mismatch repair protein MutS [Clostridiales bacterium]